MNPGTVYLIHFERPYRAQTGHCRHEVKHYLGWTTDLSARMSEHKAGRGARLMEVITAEGIAWHVARTWEGDRHLERRLKNRKKSRCLCPVCQNACRRTDSRPFDSSS